MSAPTSRDYSVAVQVMQQRCAQTGRPLDVAWPAHYFRQLLPRVEEASRIHVETTIAVLDHMTERFKADAHTVEDVNWNAPEAES